MTALAPTLQALFTDRLAQQLGASAHTIAATKLDIGDLDTTLVGSFLDYLEHERANSIRTRNGRLAAIHSTFTFAALRHPEHAEMIARVLAIPPKRYDRTQVTYLTPTEVTALLSAPDRANWTGRRDRAWILLAVTSGLRVSELTALTRADLNLESGPHVLCHGKGRKDRATPVTTETVALLWNWTKELPGGTDTPLFPTRTGRPMSRDAVAARLKVHVARASSVHPLLSGKKVTPHVLRHTAAMRLLEAGVDVMTIALWLGHESSETTQIYLHADLALKERAIARAAPTGTRPGRYQPGDRLLAFLEAL